METLTRFRIWGFRGGGGVRVSRVQGCRGLGFRDLGFRVT